MDTMVSCRPYQDVIAIYDLSDLEMFETRRRRRLAEREREKNEKQRVRWSQEDETDSTDPRDAGKYHDRLIGGNEPSGKMPGTRMLDANVYATKKTIAQGLLDVALLTANASQLKYLLQAGKEHEFYYIMMTLISLSIILQMALGIVLLLKGQCDINNAAVHCRANILNDAAVWLVFASAVVHAFLSVFHIDPGLQPPFSTYANYKNRTLPGEEYPEGFDAES